MQFGHMMGDFGFGFGIGWMIFGLIFWILIIVGLIFLIKWLIDQGKLTRPVQPVQNESPLDVLKIRYARGEITKEQFEQMKKDLEYV